jgi:DNA polymerase/3'-5' exonuclease PolX
MSGGTRVALSTAERLAEDLVNLLRRSCARIEVAGSIRRQVADVGDIDLVCIPRLVFEAETSDSFDMFGSPVAAAPAVGRSLLHERCNELLEAGQIGHRLDVNGRKSWGPSLKHALYGDLALDIRSVTYDTWAYWLTVATGPAEFSKRLVTDRRQGGLCPHHLHFKDGRLRRRDTEEPLDTPDEATLFEAMGWAWLPPKARTDTAEPRRLEGSPA